MADGTINIYVDSSFFGDSPSSEDVSVVFRTTEANNIGSFNVPVVFNISTLIQSYKDSTVEYSNTALTSGTNCIQTEYSTSSAALSGVETSLVDYYTNDKTLTGLNTYVYYMTGYLPVSGSQDVYVNFTGANHYQGFDILPVHYWNYTTNSSTLDLDTLYTNFTGSYDSMTNPIPSFNFYRDMVTEYNSGTVVSGVLNENVDITLAGWVAFGFTSDINSVLSGTNSGFNIESSVIDGGLLKNDLDIMSVLLSTKSLYSDVLCSLIGYEYLNSELNVIPGTIDYIDSDIWSTVRNIDGLICDINLHPIKISNFSIDIGSYSTADSFISVDITDDTYNIVTSGTYFLVDGDRVPVTFSGIDDGYRMYYDPVDNFTSISGSVEITAHAENDNGNYLDQSYYLTFGYYLKYYNKDLNKIDLGFNREVDVRMEAEDYAHCPTKSTDAYYFYTRYYRSSDLSSSINAIGATFSGNSSISSSIYPVSTFYFYGKVFRVKVEAKDLAGNEMAPYEFEFTIEDPNS